MRIRKKENEAAHGSRLFSFSHIIAYNVGPSKDFFVYEMMNMGKIRKEKAKI